MFQTLISVYQYATFHNPDNFTDPDSFLPERWLPSGHPRYDSRFDSDCKASFKPFSHGTRDCIGKNLALAELRFIIARLLFSFDYELQPGQQDWHVRQKNFVLWEKDALNVQLTPRAG
ncbi:hypothetical protein CDD82_3614 [Ophiocordyceps australis]|uniref:Cytochrome P450 n=1 Tax=Ophiocordyceps australis TaxID=1399860 RepID=A0A2C5Y5C8_9HYPO|nr:hypothetical protein CDD82_3614 [Ophiocordyceps australis]